jgi:hypothetical protein
MDDSIPGRSAAVKLSPALGDGPGNVAVWRRHVADALEQATKRARAAFHAGLRSHVAGVADVADSATSSGRGSMGSPGPATISLTAVGSAYGVRRSLAYLVGIIGGTTIVLVAAAAAELEPHLLGPLALGDHRHEIVGAPWASRGGRSRQI